MLKKYFKVSTVLQKLFLKKIHKFFGVKISNQQWLEIRLPSETREKGGFVFSPIQNRVFDCERNAFAECFPMLVTSSAFSRPSSPLEDRGLEEND